MVEDLTQFLESKAAEGFEPRPFYSVEGDFLSFYFREDEAYAQRVDELLTVYRSIESDDLVGCKIKGVRGLVKRLRNFGVHIDTESSSLRLGLLFLSAAYGRPAELVHYYEEMGQFSKDLSLDPVSLQPA